MGCRGKKKIRVLEKIPKNCPCIYEIKNNRSILRSNSFERTGRAAFVVWIMILFIILFDI